MSSPPSVPNSYCGSETFRKDSVGCSSSEKAPDRPRYEAAGPALVDEGTLAMNLPSKKRG